MLSDLPCVRHIPHTWGTGWPAFSPSIVADDKTEDRESKQDAVDPPATCSAALAGTVFASTEPLVLNKVEEIQPHQAQVSNLNFKYIIASDILLYVRYEHSRCAESFQ
jgi:hypothetical protein